MSLVAIDHHRESRRIVLPVHVDRDVHLIRDGRFEEFRARDIVRDDWLILMLDGVRLANEMWAIVALGVAGDGTKHMLDFEVGASLAPWRSGCPPAEPCTLHTRNSSVAQGAENRQEKS